MIDFKLYLQIVSYERMLMHFVALYCDVGCVVCGCAKVSEKAENSSFLQWLDQLIFFCSQTPLLFK